MLTIVAEEQEAVVVGEDKDKETEEDEDIYSPVEKPSAATQVE